MTANEAVTLNKIDALVASASDDYSSMPHRAQCAEVAIAMAVPLVLSRLDRIASLLERAQESR